MSSLSKELIGWDTSLLLRYITGQPPNRAQTVGSLIRQLHQPSCPIVAVVSPLVRAEIYERARDDPHNKALVDQLFFGLVQPGRNVQVRALTTAIAMKAAEIASDNKGVTTPDAVHLATALAAGAKKFWTFDGARDKKPNRSGLLIPLSGQIDGLIIEEPDEFYKLPLLQRRTEDQA